MKKTELTKDFSIFGNKGAVWSKTCHISQDRSFSGRTLCGVPMLSNNWANIWDEEEIGCPDCLAIYAKEREAVA